MASFITLLKSISILLLLCFISFSTETWALNPPPPKPSSSSSINLDSIRSVCKSTPYPTVCFDSLKLSISININPSIITYLLRSLQISLSEASKLAGILSNVGGGSPKIVEKQKGTIQDCKDLQKITESCLKLAMARIKYSPPNAKKLADAQALLSAALTNKNTCLEGLDSASGPLKSDLLNSVVEAYKHVSNSLSMLADPPAKQGLNNRRRRLMGMADPYPKWLSRKQRRILLSSGDEYDPYDGITVAADGSGNFTTITEAINFSPSNSTDRIIIYVSEGVYAENVEIPSNKPNIVLLGSGSDTTVITGNRSVGDGWTTFRSATVAVSGQGFLARDITFENTAGPEKHQAVALRINADYAALYKCGIYGYQDTLYLHTFRQFYRECDIAGTIDYIFGNAAAVFQGCNIISRLPMPGQFTVITAQSRDSPYENTGISIQNCSVVPTEDLSSAAGVRNYLGRPWKNFSRTVYIESYMDGFIEPAGWIKWPGVDDVDNLYYGEYANSGAGAATDNRVDWSGFRIMDYEEALNFTLSEFIEGDEWLDSTSFPYDDTI